MNRDRLRVALIAPYRHRIREPFAGGLEAHVWHLARRLRALGHEVRLIAPEGSDGADPELAFPRRGWRPTLQAVQDVSMPDPVAIAAHHDYLRVMLALAGSLAHDVDVVHNHALHPLPVAMAPALSAPVLTTLHTPPTPWLESAIELSSAGAGPHPSFAAVSRHTARSWTVLGERPTVVHNGVDLAAWPLGAGGEWLVWYGRLVPEKGAHLAIEVARRAGMRLRLAGPLSDSKYFAEQIAPRLGPDVQYVGHLVHDDLADLVGRSAACLVTPSWDEPFGLVVAESLACGTPVAAFARGGIPELVGCPEAGGLAPAGDIDALVAQLPRVVALDRGVVRRVAHQHLSIERMVDEYVSLYHDLVAARRPEPGETGVLRALRYGA